jgi:hypothetical protein
MSRARERNTFRRIKHVPSPKPLIGSFASLRLVEAIAKTFAL